MKILVTGFTGYLGRMIHRHLQTHHDVYGASSSCPETERTFRCNLRHESEVVALARKIQPDAIIHAAGLKDIAFCEKNAAEAFAINSMATHNIANIFGKRRVIYISTDYVFDGKSGRYSERHAPNPSTVYGNSKLTGEIQGTKVAGNNFLIVRTGVVYDEESKYMRFLRENLSSRRSIDCYTNAHYAPAYYRDFLRLLGTLIRGEYERNVFHVCGSRLSRYEFAVLAAKAFSFDQTLVRPTTRSDEHWYLFSDLSLTSDITHAYFNCEATPHASAVKELASQFTRP